MSTDDFLARLDAAIGCQQCGGPLGNSPSDDFCSDEHQRRWHADRADRLPPSPDAAAVYVEADHVRVPLTEPGFYSRGGLIDTNPHHLFPCQGCHRPLRSMGRPRCPACDFDRAVAQRDWRLPVMTSNLSADIRACNRARSTATTDWQRAAVALRTEQLVERSREPFRQMVEAWERAACQIGAAVNQVARSLRAAMGQPEPPERTGDDRRDRMAEALVARQNRNTGPPRAGRPPRRIDSPGVRR